MNFKSMLTPGTITGILSFIGAITVALGKPALGAFLSDPTTAATLTGVISGAMALVAGAMTGVGAAATPAAK